MITAELSGEAEMLIRTEGLSKISQGQRIDLEIIDPRGRSNKFQRNVLRIRVEKVCCTIKKFIEILDKKPIW